MEKFELPINNPIYKVYFGTLDEIKSIYEKLINNIPCDIKPYADFGNTDYISEYIANNIVDKIDNQYMNYISKEYSCITAKESFRTLSNLPNCIISKL